MKKHVYRIMAVVLAFLYMISSGQTYSAYTEGESVRVGIYEMEGFHYYDDNEELKGYCIDYLNVISALTGWNYEYVEVDDFMEGYRKLEAHEIDLLAPAMMTDERKSLFSFSDHDFGTEYTVLMTSSDREDLFFEDFENFNGKKVAVLNGYPLTQYFISYMEMHEFTTELVYFDNSEESKAALQNGEVDAVVTSIMDMDAEHKLLARFAPQSFYFMTYKENYELLGELNEAMSRIEETYPSLLQELLINYYPVYETQFYTREEVEYVDSARTLRVAYEADRKPLSFTDEHGEFRGICREIFDRISELSGLRFEYVELPAGEISYDYLQSQHIDLITGVEYNSANMNSRGIFMSRPYISSRKVMVSRPEFIYSPKENYKVAVIAGSKTLKSVLNEKYPNMEIINYDTLDECLRALYMGEVDILLQNQYVVEGLVGKPIYNEFSVIPIDGLKDEHCFSTIVSLNDAYGMDEEESTLVISILNKAIAQITDVEMDNIVMCATVENQYELDIFDFLYSYRFTIAMLFILAVVILAVNAFVQKERKETEKHRREEERRNILQQKRYKTIIDSSQDLFYEIGLNGEGNISSEKIKKKFGWEIPAEVDALDFAKAMEILHVHPDDEHVFRQSMLTEGEGNYDEQVLRLQKADGEYIWCRVSRTLLMDENGNLVSVLGKIVDVDEEVKEKTSLVRKTRTDLLTGLLNKQTFKKEVRDYLEVNSGIGACFVFIDLDHFKDINDVFGHAIGDKVIKETAKKIQLLFANFDLVGRFGGDEFCVFVKEIPKDTLVDRLDFAIKKMEQEYQYESGTVKISASIGATYCFKQKVTYEELMDVADAAAYKAKDNGRNCYILDEIIEDPIKN